MFQGALHFYDGRFDLALEPLRKAFQMDPENASIQMYYASSLARNNQVDDAISIIDRMVKASPKGFLAKSMQMLKLALLNNRDAVLREMTLDSQKNIKKEGSNWAYWVAVPLALIGAKKKALDWLEYGLNWFFNYPLLAEKDPFLANIRGEPRFQKLMERVKYEWEHFEV
jgi:tetratricopeptide (TPR) repeat protein